MNIQSQIQTDTLIIGAGPCGLFQAFQLGLQGIGCCIVEALDYPGGQCAELYPDKPVYDIPGIPHTNADNLTNQLLKQIQPFEITIHHSQLVHSIESVPTGEFLVRTHQDSLFCCRNIVLATGAGAFSPVKMRLEGLEEFEKNQVCYQEIDATTVAGKAVVVNGDTLSAVRTALEVCEHAAKTVLVHRKRRFPIDQQTMAKLDQFIREKKIGLIKGKITEFHAVDTRLEKITVSLATKDALDIETDVILPRLGNSPKTSAFEQWGLALKQNHLVVDSVGFETSIKGIYAIGDANTYSGKRKLILCGFHEATMAAFAIAKSMNPDKPVHTLYTTTSTELQKRLKVSVPVN